MTSTEGADAATGAIVRRTIVIENERGLHARAAAKFVQVAGRFEADVTVHKDGTVVSGRSIMGLMMLAAGLGCEIELAASGGDAEEALAALAGLVAAKFEET
ncbi:MAG: HPr family phosphocarrier protein [Alphaproteobacteria bacterium]